MGPDEGLAMMKTVADRLEAIGLSGATEASIRVGYLVILVKNEGDPRRSRLAATRDATPTLDPARRGGACRWSPLPGCTIERGHLEPAIGGDISAIEDRSRAARRRCSAPVCPVAFRAACRDRDPRRSLIARRRAPADGPRADAALPADRHAGHRVVCRRQCPSVLDRCARETRPSRRGDRGRPEEPRIGDPGRRRRSPDHGAQPRSARACAGASWAS